MTSADETSDDASNFNNIQARRTAISLAGYTGHEASARSALNDTHPSVRAAALSALHRIGTLTSVDVADALTDADLRVRRRACEIATLLPLTDLASPTIDDLLLAFLRTGDETMAELGAWSLGERHQQQSAWQPNEADENHEHDEHNEGNETDVPARTSAAEGFTAPKRDEIVQALSDTVYRHSDALVREAAVAALGCIGTPEAKAPILHAIRDKATVRRRAIIALAAFEGDDVEAALAQATGDRDWQVRQAAEDLLA
jgi:HEAT repeat protein